ncbi:hypothetical protein HDV06_005305 [Boothiomyces sp. JEL0866]|nr:hypothetical protein HDV06_005305 [Boothiomyces sp. JEL0866]
MNTSKKIKELSQNRTKNWTQTVAGQTRLRKEQREAEILAKALAEKEKSDAAEREILQRRNNAIGRARKLQYMETDMVKNFHSKVNEMNVLHEREMQLKLKESRKNSGMAEDIQLMSFQLQKYHTEKLKEEARTIEKFTQRINLAREHLHQAQEKKMQHEQDKQNELSYGLQLLSDSQKYKEEQIAMQQKKKIDSQLFRKELDQMRQDAINRKNWEEYEDYTEEVKIEKWNAFKDYQDRMKEQIEEKWFKESLEARSKIGESIRQKQENENEKLFEILKKQELVSQKKHQEEAEMKARKKQELHRSMKEYYELHKNRKEREAEEEKKRDLELLVQYKKLAEDAKLSTFNERKKTLKTNLEIQEFNLGLAKQKNSTKADSCVIDKAEEDNKFRNYMVEVANEQWALKNPRIQEYVQKQLLKHEKQEKIVKAPSKTHKRLGFQGHTYNSIDLAGNNEVVKGQYLDILVNGQKFNLQNKN